MFKGNKSNEKKVNKFKFKISLFLMLFIYILGINVFLFYFYNEASGNSGVIIRKNSAPFWYIEESEMKFNDIELELFLQSVVPNYVSVFVDSYAKKIRVTVNGRFSIRNILNTYQEYIDVEVNERNIGVRGFLVKSFEIPQFPVNYTYSQNFKSYSALSGSGGGDIGGMSGGGAKGGGGSSGGGGGSGSDSGTVNIKSEQSFWSSIKGELQSIISSSVDNITGGGSSGGGSSSSGGNVSGGVPQSSASAATMKKLPSVSGSIHPVISLADTAGGVGGASSDGSFVSYNQISSTIIVGTTKSKMKFVEQYLNSIINKISETVEVELTILEIMNNDDLETNVSWQTVLRSMLFPTKTFVGGSADAAVSLFGNSGGLTLRNSSNAYGIGVSSLYNNTQQAILQAIRKVTNARIIDKTTILLRNNSAGGFTSGTALSYIDSVNQSQTSGGNSSFSVQKGTILSGIDIMMTATINDRKITLTITPSLSHLQKIENLQFAGLTIQNPVVDIRKSIATVTVSDGGTTAIVGYNSNKNIIDKERMPIIGDIPVVGWLFGKNLNISNSSSVLMLLTPRIKKI